MEIDVYFRFFFALIFTLSLIGLLYWAVRYFGLTRFSGFKTVTKRLSISEILRIDAKHKLLIIKRDSQEHLVLLSQDSGCLIESSVQNESSDMTGSVSSFKQELNNQKIKSNEI